LLEELPSGLLTLLGEGGGLLSGGQGQRVRLGRALLRPDIGLAILDEPFRGLDGSQRRHLLARVRELWQGATLLLITHDVEQTRDFDRVLVIREGRLAEQGHPAELARRPDSVYRALLQAEERLKDGLWNGSWRRLDLEAGRLAEEREHGADKS
jgi:ATP-binding cassette subfamily B protein